jgi:hypothetical protein
MNPTALAAGSVSNNLFAGIVDILPQPVYPPLTDSLTHRLTDLLSY